MGKSPLAEKKLITHSEKKFPYFRLTKSMVHPKIIQKTTAIGYDLHSIYTSSQSVYNL